MKKIYEGFIRAEIICVQEKLFRQERFSTTVTIPFSYILFAEDEKCANLIITLSKEYNNDYLESYILEDTEISLFKNLTMDILAKSVVVEEVGDIVSYEYLSKRMLVKDFIEYIDEMKIKS